MITIKKTIRNQLVEFTRKYKNHLIEGLLKNGNNDVVDARVSSIPTESTTFVAIGSDILVWL